MWRPAARQVCRAGKTILKTDGALLFVEYAGKDRQAEIPWRLVVVPRPALEPLAEAMRKLLLADCGEAIRSRAEAGIGVFTRTTGD
jgi:hypothetical protein